MTEEVEEEHRLENVAHDENAHVSIAAERELEARREGVERAHTEALHQHDVCVAAGVLTQEIRQVHRVLGHVDVQAKMRVSRDQRERLLAHALLFALERLQVFGDGGHAHSRLAPFAQLEIHTAVLGTVDGMCAR